VIILAAGAGRRLYPLTKDKPKCLLELEKDFTILEHIVSNLPKQIKEIMIVCGNGEKEIQNFVLEKLHKYNLPIQLVKNDFKFKENFYSLYLGLSKVEEGQDVIIINSDVVSDKSIFRDLLAADGSSLVVDIRKELDEEDMKVQIENGYIKKIGKNLDPKVCQGEYIGLAKISSKDIHSLKEALESMINNKIEDWYERAFQIMIDKGAKLGVVDTRNRVWCEVDTLEDLEKARKCYAKIK